MYFIFTHSYHSAALHFSLKQFQIFIWYDSPACSTSFNISTSAVLLDEFFICMKNVLSCHCFERYFIRCRKLGWQDLGALFVCFIFAVVVFHFSTLKALLHCHLACIVSNKFFLYLLFFCRGFFKIFPLLLILSNFFMLYLGASSNIFCSFLCVCLLFIELLRSVSLQFYHIWKMSGNYPKFCFSLTSFRDSE